MGIADQALAAESVLVPMRVMGSVRLFAFAALLTWVAAHGSPEGVAELELDSAPLLEPLQDELEDLMEVGEGKLSRQATMKTLGEGKLAQKPIKGATPALSMGFEPTKTAPKDKKKGKKKGAKKKGAKTGKKPAAKPSPKPAAKPAAPKPTAAV